MATSKSFGTWLFILLIFPILISSSTWNFSFWFLYFILFEYCGIDTFSQLILRLVFQVLYLWAVTNLVFVHLKWTKTLVVVWFRNNFNDGRGFVFVFFLSYNNVSTEFVMNSPLHLIQIQIRDTKHSVYSMFSSCKWKWWKQKTMKK